MAGKDVLLLLPSQIPRKCRITTVIGAAIPVVRNEDPTDDEVRAVLEKYMAGLQHIFNKYKDQYASDRKEELNLI